MNGPQEPDPGQATIASGMWSRLRTPAGLAVVTLLLGLLVGYAVGHGRSPMHEAEVACMSAPGSISCGPVDSPEDAEYGVPRDVAWTANGAFHEDGRPDCLPPTGRGTVRVHVTWTTVEVDGVSWKQVVGVHC